MSAHPRWDGAESGDSERPALVWLGALAILQAGWLPGYAIVRAARFRRGSAVETLVVSLALSLVANYLFAFGAALLHAYTRPNVFGLIAVECAVLGLAIARDVRSGDTARLVLWPEIRFTKPIQAVVCGLAAAALAGLAAFAFLAAARFTVFSTWDVVFQWNIWATTWSTGTIPSGTGLYPQLVPTIWSTMYLVLGSPEMQSFPLAFMAVFPVLTVAMMLDLGIRQREMAWVIASALTAIALYAVRYSMPLASGLVDPPLVFMVLAALYALALRPSVPIGTPSGLILPLTLACGASVTKVNGSFPIALVLLAAIVGHVRNRDAGRARRAVASLALSLGVIALIPGTWYGRKLADILAGRDGQNAGILVSATSSATHETSLIGRVLGSVHVVPGQWVTVAGVLLLMLVTLRARKARWVSLGVLLYTMLWGAFLGYDFRNELVVVPFIGYLAGVAVAQVLGLLGVSETLDVETGRGVSVGRRGLAIVSAVMVAVVAAASVLFPYDRVLAHELASERMLGVPSLDAALYKADAQAGGLSGPLLTDYWYVRVLPGLRSDATRPFRAAHLLVHATSSQEIAPAMLGGYRYLLLSDELPQDTQAALKRQQSAGMWRVVFSADGGLPGEAYGAPTTVRLLESRTASLTAQPGRP